MKKRILSILLSIVMLIGMLPAAALPAFAESGIHDLAVTRNGGTVTEGTDYEWDGSVLCILKDGLTVSGNTDSERIYVGGAAKEVTFDGLNVTVPAEIASDAVALRGGCKLILKGKNIIINNNSSYSAVYFASYGKNEITGEGSLEVNAAHDGIFTDGTLTVSVSGPITVDAGHIGITSHSDIFLASADNGILVYGSDNGSGAVEWAGELDVAGGLAISGSTADGAEKENITDKLSYSKKDHNLKIGTNTAKSILVTPLAPEEGHDLIVKRGYSKAVLDTDYAWNSKDSDNLVILNSDVIVSGETDKEYITVSEYADKLTIRDLSVTVSGHDAITFLSDSELELKGDNTLTVTDDAHSAVYFDDNGDSVITGDGSLTVESQHDGIFASGSLAVSSAGAIVINALGNGIFAPYKLEITYDVSKILVYGSDEDFGAVRLGDSFVAAEEQTIKGSDVFGAEEADITDEVTCNGDYPYMAIGDKVAKSVLITHLTLADILDTVTGTYSAERDEKKGDDVIGTTCITVTVSENMISQESITFLGDGLSGNIAMKMLIDDTGFTGWETDTFVDGKPQYGEPEYFDSSETIADYLSSYITVTEEDDDYYEDFIIPAGSYYSEYLYFSFYDIENGKAQKLCNYDFEIELDRVPEHEHEFSDAEYTWSGADCTATAACTGCSETVTETKTGEFKQDTAATCTEAAKGHYEVTFGNTMFGSAATDKNSVTFGDPNGHTWTEARENKAGKSSLKAAATCTADAVYYKVCSVCDAVSEDLTWTDEGTAGHKFTGKAVSNGDGTHSFKCTGCTAVGTMNGNTAVENGRVNCSGGTATCQSGAVCSACNAVYTEKNPANHVGTANLVKGAVKATCTNGGYTGDTYWSCCQNELYKKGTATGTNANNHTDANGDGICDDCGNCSKCGKTHASNFWGKIVCFFNRIGNWFRNLFK